MVPQGCSPESMEMRARLNERLAALAAVIGMLPEGPARTRLEREFTELRQLLMLW